MKSASNAHLKETFAVGGLASLLLLILSWPAFRYFFFAEAFWHLRIYNLHDRHLWEAAFSRIDGMFFRPGLFLSQIWWDFVLPADPMVYHIRNFVFCAVNLFLLHRVLLKFVRSRPARFIALGIFAASKMHMTIIGYINLYESSILLMTILLAVLFWFRYIETRRATDYFLAFLFCTFSIFSKDNGFAVIVILAAMVPALAIKPGELKSQIRYWGVRFMPFVIVSASYLILRYVLTGPINPDNPVYSPRLSFSNAVWQAQAFFTTVGNLSLGNPSSMGARGLGGVLASSRAVEFALCAGLWLVIVYTLWRGRSSWRLLIVPVVWIGLYLSPILLIRNHQVYYYQEPLVGVALMVGICLDQARRPLLTAWGVAFALIATNGFISNQSSYYDWQYMADRAEVVKPIVATQRCNPPKIIVFVTSPDLRDFWSYTIGGPIVPQLLGSPDTRVDVVDSPPPTGPDTQVYNLDVPFK